MICIFDRGLICSSGAGFQIELFHPRWTDPDSSFIDLLHYFGRDRESGLCRGAV